MNPYYTSFLYSILFCSLITPFSTYSEFSLKRVCAVFGANPYHEVIDQQYPIPQGSTLSISNDFGNISIKTEWKRDTIYVKATKSANKPEFLSSISILDTLSGDENNACLTLTTVRDQKEIRGSIDYELIIPAHVSLKLETKKGTITVRDVTSPLKAITYQGDIKVHNISNDLFAESKQKGSIYIDQAKGDITAHTNRGDITIHHANNSIFAQAQRGTIQALCSKLPSTSNINLVTTQGPIELILPQRINAKVHGRTKHGTLTSSYSLTLNPITTTLDTRAWSRFKKEVEGMIGSGGAEIKLNSASGNIKIVQATPPRKK